MSMHKIPLTQSEEEGLKAHGLDIGVPSQLSDVFRSGMAWGRESAPEPSASVGIGPVALYKNTNKLGGMLAELLDEDQFAHCEHYLLAITDQLATLQAKLDAEIDMHKFSVAAGEDWHKALLAEKEKLEQAEKDKAELAAFIHRIAADEVYGTRATIDAQNLLAKYEVKKS